MLRTLILLIMLTSVLMAQAASDNEVNIKRDRVILRHTSSPRLRSSIALIYDVRGQRTLFTKNADTVAPIASISKLMTAMVVLDAQLPIGEEIRISEQDIDTLKSTHSRMRSGMTLTRGELLKVALMAFQNRARSRVSTHLSWRDRSRRSKDECQGERTGHE